MHVVCSEIVIEKKKLRISKRRICLVLKRSVDKGNLFECMIIISDMKSSFISNHALPLQ